MVTKLDFKGELIWEKTYQITNGAVENPADSSMKFNSENINNISIDGNGDIYLTGTLETAYAIGDFQKTLVLAIKIDSDGNKIWDKILGTPGVDDEHWRIIKSSFMDGNGNIYVTGTTAHLAGRLGSTDNRLDVGFGNTFIIKLDSDGNTKWGRRYGYSLYTHERLRDEFHMTSSYIDYNGSIYIIGNRIMIEDTGPYDVCIQKPVVMKLNSNSL